MNRFILWSVNLFVYCRYLGNVLRFRRRVGYLPNIANPSQYSEKVLWRKLFDHNPVFRTFCDKISTKVYASSLCPNLPVTETLWMGHEPDKIPTHLLENAVAIKASHGCGYNLFPEAGSTLSQEQHGLLSHWLGNHYGTRTLEWGYQAIERRLLIEPLIVGRQDKPIIDLCIHAVNGKAILLEAILSAKTDRQRKGYFHIDGTRWRALEKKGKTTEGGTFLPLDFQLPAQFVDAIAFTQTLGAKIDYARFDFICCEHKLYGGEITVYPGSGLMRADVFKKYNQYVTHQWDIAQSWFLTEEQTGWKRLYAQALRSCLASSKICDEPPLSP